MGWAGAASSTYRFSNTPTQPPLQPLSLQLNLRAPKRTWSNSTSELPSDLEQLNLLAPKRTWSASARRRRAERPLRPPHPQSRPPGPLQGCVCERGCVHESLHGTWHGQTDHAAQGGTVTAVVCKRAMALRASPNRLRPPNRAVPPTLARTRG